MTGVRPRRLHGEGLACSLGTQGHIWGLRFTFVGGMKLSCSFLTYFISLIYCGSLCHCPKCHLYGKLNYTVNTAPSAHTLWQYCVLLPLTAGPSQMNSRHCHPDTVTAQARKHFLRAPQCQVHGQCQDLGAVSWDPHSHSSLELGRITHPDVNGILATRCRWVLNNLLLPVSASIEGHQELHLSLSVRVYV